MENKYYYYLDGAEKKGPLSKEQIIELNLSEETLIFSVELNKWIRYNEFDDFKQKIEGNNLSKKKFNYANLLTLLILILLAIIISYYLTEKYSEKDYLKLESKVNEIFNGKDQICDYSNFGVTGKLKKPKDDRLGQLVPEHWKKLDDEGKELYERFYCETGGWTVFTLKKLNNGYDLIELTSMDMGFKVPESIYYPGKDIGFGYTTSGYSVPSNRGTIQGVYNMARSFMTVEKEDNSYLAGSYNRILTFHELNSDIHYIDNIHPTSYTSASEVNSKSWETIEDATIFNKNWILWYKKKGKHFEIVLDESLYLNKMMLNIGIGITISILLFILWIFRIKDRIYN